MRELAAAFKQALSPRSSKAQYLATSNHSNKQGSEMRHWLCGCTAARSKSSITSATADAYLEAPLVVNRRSSSASGSMLESDCRAASQESCMSQPSELASSDSSGAGEWKSLDGSAVSRLSSRQQSWQDNFSSYNPSVIFEEQSTDAAWREFTSWRLKWKQVSATPHKSSGSTCRTQQPLVAHAWHKQNVQQLPMPLNFN